MLAFYFLCIKYFILDTALDIAVHLMICVNREGERERVAYQIRQYKTTYWKVFNEKSFFLSCNGCISASRQRHKKMPENSDRRFTSLWVICRDLNMNIDIQIPSKCHHCTTFQWNIVSFSCDRGQGVYWFM